VSFEEKNSRTTITIKTVFGSVAMKDEHMGMGYEQGVGAGLDQLAAHVRALEAE
jgi:hypothetical protein